MTAADSPRCSDDAGDAGVYEAVVRRTAEGLKSERVMRGIKAQVGGPSESSRQSPLSAE